MSPDKKIVRGYKHGFFDRIGDYFKLIVRLIQDERVNPLLKLLPFGGVLYFFFPFDIPGPFDDAAAIWFMTQLFVEMCPPEVVTEHRMEIEKTIIAEWKEDIQEDIKDEDVVDADYEDKKEKK